MKFSFKSEDVLLFCALLLSCVTVYLTFSSSPDVILFRINGYKFGLNWSSNTLLKIISFATMALVLITREVVHENKINEQQ